MRKIAPLLLGLLALACTLSACDVTATPVAARVNGVEISVTTLNADLHTAANDAGYRCFLTAQAQSQSQGGLSVFGAGAGTYSSSFVATQLGFLLDGEAVHLGLSSIGLQSANPIALKAARAELFAQFTPQSGGTCHEKAQSVFNQLDPSFRKILLEYYGDETTIAAHFAGLTLTSAGVTSYEKAHASAVDLDCVDAVITKTKAQAAEVATQLDKGANFAAVAKANSIDAASAEAGGRVGCLNPSQISAPVGTTVASLKVGAISQPLALGSDWVVVEVASRSFPSVPNAVIAVVNPVYSEAGFSTLLTKMIKQAKFEISPAYGTAAITNGAVTVTPVPGPKAAYVPNFVPDLVTHN